MADSRVKENKLAEIQEKAQKRNVVVEKENQARENLIKHSEEKIKGIGSANKEEVDRINAKKLRKEQELKKMSSLEMELLHKHSESQAAYLQVKSKLDSMLHTVKADSAMCKKSLKVSMHIGKEKSERNSAGTEHSLLR